MHACSHQPWQAPPLLLAEVVACAQADAADRLLAMIASRQLDRRRYRDWLASESATCRIAALTLDAVAGWHRPQDPLRATALAWADQLRTWVVLAASDVRRLDGVPSAPPAALGAWHAFHLQAGGCQRAGEALGAAVLQACLYEGPARTALEALRALPIALVASAYVDARLQSGPIDAGRALLLDAYSNTALIAGAQRGADWLRDVFFETFPPAPR